MTSSSIVQTAKETVSDYYLPSRFALMKKAVAETASKLKLKAEIEVGFLPFTIKLQTASLHYRH